MTDDHYKFAIYLLHFEPAFGRQQHYVGSARRDQLQLRLRRHASQTGSSVTRRAVAAGCRLFLSALEYAPSRAAEYRMKRGKALRYRCPICSGTLELENALELHPVKPLNPGASPWTPFA